MAGRLVGQLGSCDVVADELGDLYVDAPGQLWLHIKGSTLTLDKSIAQLQALANISKSLPDAARDAIAAMRDGGLEDDADALERALEAAK